MNDDPKLLHNRRLLEIFMVVVVELGEHAPPELRELSEKFEEILWENKTFEDVIPIRLPNRETNMGLVRYKEALVGYVASIRPGCRSELAAIKQAATDVRESAETIAAAVKTFKRGWKSHGKAPEKFLPVFAKSFSREAKRGRKSPVEYVRYWRKVARAPRQMIATTPELMAVFDANARGYVSRHFFPKT